MADLVVVVESALESALAAGVVLAVSALAAAVVWLALPLALFRRPPGPPGPPRMKPPPMTDSTSNGLPSIFLNTDT